MIRALIVDDEKITRKGMISVIPWDRFDIEIVADVGSASAALALLASRPIDLVFVDVAMPGMNGIELIREIRARGYPCAVVVLTFYDDFPFIQEALRLGAIDYVLKTQLDDEKMLAMLQRVTRRLGEERASQDLYCLVAVHDGGTPVESILGELPPEARESAVRAGGAALLRLRGGVAEISAAARRLGGALVKLRAPAGVDASTLARVGARLARHVFYECRTGADPCTVDLAAIDSEPCEAAPEPLASLRRAWSGASWLLQEEAWRKIVERTLTLRPPVAELTELLGELRRDLVQAFTFLAACAGEPEPPATWAQWQQALNAMREAVRRRVSEHRHSEEIARKVVEAVNVIRQTAGRYMKEEEVAARVGLSRSWFSQCFKEITGCEFKRYLIDKSVAEAKKLLERTQMPFRSISANLGYQNEGHFSRVFRESTGITPRDFRALSRAPKEST